MYCASWCRDCTIARRFFRERNIPFREIDIDKRPEAEAGMRAANGDLGKIPTVIYGDKILVEPSLWELKAAFADWSADD